jgi:8-oxo-dGTP pyrophosphatase MutT (NUDIX family)
MAKGVGDVAPNAVDKTAIRNASTILLVRDIDSTPRVLMGQRGASAAFMPNKFVFPGGAVDAGDANIVLATSLPKICETRLAGGDVTPNALAAGAIRELWEETGLCLGTPGAWHGTPPADWADFAARGLLPAAGGLSFIFRAITPPGRPRRFDARFFLADARHVSGALDDFSAACDELTCLQWIPLPEARRFNLPFITEVVLAEVDALIASNLQAPSVPFFDHTASRSEFRRIA